MRELIAEEIMAVAGAGSAWCEMVSGRMTCECDYAEGTWDDLWMYGNDGTWIHMVNGSIESQGGDLN